MPPPQSLRGSNLAQDYEVERILLDDGWIDDQLLHYGRAEL